MYTTTTTTKSLQSCPTLCDPMNGSPPGSPIPGILQAGILEIKCINKYKLKCQSFFFIMVLCNNINDLRKKQLNYIILKVKGRNDGRKNISCKLFDM